MSQRAVALAAVAALSAGCIHRDRYVYAAELANHAAEIRATGAAQVATYEAVEDKVFGPDLVVMRTAQRLGVQGGSATVGELVQHCGSGSDGDGGFCTLDHLIDSKLIISSEHHDTVDAVGRGIWIGARVGFVLGSITCAIACNDTPLQVTAGVAAGLYVLYQLTRACHGCHD